MPCTNAVRTDVSSEVTGVVCDFHAAKDAVAEQRWRLVSIGRKG